MALNRPFEMRAALDSDGLVDDIPLDTRGGRQPDLNSANAAHNPARHDHIIGDNLAFDCRILTHRQQMCLDVAFDSSLDLHITGGLHMTRYHQVRRQDRR